jgi:hypothetical protein
MPQENQSWLDRLRRKLAAPVNASNRLAPDVTATIAGSPDLETSVTMETESKLAARANHVVATSIDDIIRVEEVADAEFFIGDLFRRRFGSDPPNYPRSFVAFYQPVRSRLEAAGFVHYLAHEDSYLCGGLVIDERRYRRMPLEHRMVIKAAGGIAEKMLRVTFARLADAPAIWGYVGDRLSEEVCLRVGFRHTEDRYILVCWNKDLPAEEKAQRLAKVAALGPF